MLDAVRRCGCAGAVVMVMAGCSGLRVWPEVALCEDGDGDTKTDGDQTYDGHLTTEPLARRMLCQPTGG